MTHGLYNKYTVTKTDGTPTDPNAQYFVLRIDTDPAAVIALGIYARLQNNLALRDNLIEWIASIEASIPSFERGDKCIHKGRPAVVIGASKVAHGEHVTDIEYDDQSGGYRVYTGELSKP